MKLKSSSTLEESGAHARERSDGCEPTLPPPAGLKISRFGANSEEFALLEWDAASRRPQPVPCDLTPAEIAVAELVLAGFSNAEIGRMRRTSARTVANQLASLYRKLGLGSRLELFAVLRVPTGRKPQ